MRILAIETSCDETSFAVITATQMHADKTQINADGELLPHIIVEKNLVASQVKLHAPFGGVVPMLAKREHLKNLPILWKQMQKIKEVKNKEIDLLGVTVGPGLEPALWTGVQFAQEICKEYFQSKVPLVGVNHLEGHLYSFLLAEKTKFLISNFQFPIKSKVQNLKKGININNSSPVTSHLFPMVSLVVSGGHTILGVLKSLTEYKKLGETLDDAVGESFDKVARLLDLPYPGGPLIEQLAKEGNTNAIKLPHPMQYQKNYNFSYAGLKTAVLYYLRTQGVISQNFSPKAVAKKAKISAQLQKDLSASFQEAAFASLVAKTKRAVEEYGARTVCIGGGVAANKRLPELLRDALGDMVQVIVPPLEYCQDNAAMIALAGYIRHKTEKDIYPLSADGTMSI
jgi:N6-L-threonylcarbamoyladenine synthase